MVRSSEVTKCDTWELDHGNRFHFLLSPLHYLLSHKEVLSLSTLTLVVTATLYFRFDAALTCFTMRFFFVVFLWALIPFASSSLYEDGLWGFDDTSFSSESWSFDESPPLAESSSSSFSGLELPSFSESDPDNESTSSMFMAYNDGDLATDTTLVADNDLFNGEESSGWDEFHPEDDVISTAVSAPDEVSLDLEANCGGSFQYNGKRRTKRGERCKNQPTSTDKLPDSTGPSLPLPGGTSFFPGYGKYVMDKKTNVLRIPGYVPRVPGENDVCLIYTEGYLPYGVCGTELFNSVDAFWGIQTYTITKAQLGKLPTLGVA